MEQVLKLELKLHHLALRPSPLRVDRPMELLIAISMKLHLVPTTKKIATISTAEDQRLSQPVVRNVQSSPNART